MIKVLCACGNGMGTSLIMKIKVEKILSSHSKEKFSVDSCSVSEATSISQNYDVIVCSTHLEESFDKNKIKIVGLKNILDETEIEQKLRLALKK